MEDWKVEDEDEERWEEMIQQNAVKHASMGQEQETLESHPTTLAAVQQAVTQRLLAARQKRTAAEEKWKILHQQRENLDIKFNSPGDSDPRLSDEDYDAQRAKFAVATKETLQILLESAQEEKDLNTHWILLSGGGGTEGHPAGGEGQMMQTD